MPALELAIVASVAPNAQDRPQARRAAWRIGGPALAGIARLVAAWLDCGRIGPMGEAVGRVRIATLAASA